jgi:predicted house-cleaning noncanonical NTP pyrophosphatase (MazG superfamily)
LDGSWLADDPHLAETFGAKALGLSRLPAAWVPPTLAISTDLSAIVRGGGGEPEVLEAMRALWPAIERWALDKGITGAVILRSSATQETILDRGKFQSLEVASLDVAMLAGTAFQILRHFIGLGAPGEMAFLLQPMKTPRALGHMANIRRVSKTRNQWEYEVVGTPSFSAKIEGRFNSQRATAPGALLPLPAVNSEDTLRTTLQQVGKWVVDEEIGPLVSIEWVAADDALWLVQCDDESAARDAVDPRALTFPMHGTASANAPLPFKRYVVGDATEVRKLSLLSDFSPPGYPSSHAINYASGAELLAALTSAEAQSQLGKAITDFAPDGIVVRTARIGQGGGKAMNLPRTDTVTGPTAVEWIKARITDFGAEGCSPDKAAFLMHRFIPARKAAWSYCAPGDRQVRIDALWGLPDGIQFYPCDNHEFDLVTGRDERPTIQYKPYLLWPAENGDWKKRPVHPDHARRQCLSKQEIEQIARHAAAITKLLDCPTQIMWFCDFPEGSEHDKPLPWYRDEKAHRPLAQSAAPYLPRLIIETKKDLEALLAAKGTPKSRLILDPQPSAIRDPEFIDLVTRCAQQGQHAVVLEGSALAHAFYQLDAAGVPVYSLRGTGRQRAVRKREFGKLVRDKIPEVVAATGETAVYGKMPELSRKRILIAKAVEELWELFHASGPDEVQEAADLYEVFGALLKTLGVSWDDVQKEAERKRSKRGGFEQGFVLVQTSLPRDAPTGLLPPSDDRTVQIPSRAALEAASAIEVDGREATFPFFALLDGDQPSQAKVRIGRERLTVDCRLEGDRIVVELGLIEPRGPQRAGEPETEEAASTVLLSEPQHNDPEDG